MNNDKYYLLVKIQEFIDENNFDFITVDGVIEYYKDFYKKNNYNDNNYTYVCKNCENVIELLIK